MEAEKRMRLFFFRRFYHLSKVQLGGLSRYPLLLLGPPDVGPVGYSLLSGPQAHTVFTCASNQSAPKHRLAQKIQNMVRNHTVPVLANR
jgi:hypothetical protein